MKKAPFILFFLFLPLIVCGQNTREDLDKIFQDASADLTSEVDGFNAYAEEALEEELLKKYGLTVEAVFDWIIEKEIKIERIHIKLPKNADGEVKREMLEYLTKNYCSEVLIE